MAEPVTEPDALELGRRHAQRIGAPGQFERDGDIFQRGQGAHQVESLEDDPHILPTEAGQPVLGQAGKIGAGHPHPSGTGAFQPGHHHQEARFAGSRRSDHAQGFSRPKAQIDIGQDIDLACRPGQCEGHFLKQD